MLKPINFNPNNPKLWKDFDPTEQAEEFVDNKSETFIRRSLAHKKKYEDIEIKEKHLINVKKGVEARGSNQDWLKKQAEKSLDPEVLANQTQGCQERSRKKTWQDNQKVGYQKRLENPSWQQKQEEWHKTKGSDPEYIKLMEETNRRTAENEDWIRKTCRPIKCPYGIFKKAKDGFDQYHTEYGGNRASVINKLRKWCKDENNTEWTYLTWEEFDQLTKQ